MRQIKYFQTAVRNNRFSEAVEKCHICSQMKMLIDRCLPDVKEAGMIYGTSPWNKGDAYQHPACVQVYGIGKQI